MVTPVCEIAVIVVKSATVTSNHTYGVQTLQQPAAMTLGWQHHDVTKKTKSDASRVWDKVIGKVP